jgi:hypothetical protein
MKITAALLSIATALTMMAWWAAAGASWFTLQKVLVSKTIVDDFGDKVTQQEWVPRFVPGLLDLCGPAAGGLLLLAAVLLWLSRADLQNDK